MFQAIKKIVKSIIIFSYFNFLKIGFTFRKQHSVKNKNLLVIKLDAIGDYVLFRNFLEILHHSAKYQDYKITFCGSDYVRDLAEKLDGEYVDEFIWINKTKIFYRPLYLFKIATCLFGRFSVVLQATYSRDLIGDVLVKFSGASERIGFSGDWNNQGASEKKRTDTWYTKLITVSEANVFEFYKNKEFFEKVCEEKIYLASPVINVKKLPVNCLDREFLKISKDYIVFFPGSRNHLRRFSPSGFGAIANYLQKKYSCSLVVSGSLSDQKIAMAIKTSSSANIIDLSGQTNLLELAALIVGARLLISNDTAAVHIAMALGVKTIVLSQFDRYYRFVPYPEDISQGRMICLTPDKYRELNQEELIKKFSLGSDENINLIDLNNIFKTIDKLMTSF